MIVDVQNQLIELLNIAKEQSLNTESYAPAFIGYLTHSGLKSTSNFPRVFVGVGEEYKISSISNDHSIADLQIDPVIIVQDKNYSGVSEEFVGGNNLTEWVYNALKSKQIELNGMPRIIANRFIVKNYEDADPFTAIIKLEL